MAVHDDLDGRRVETRGALTPDGPLLENLIAMECEIDGTTTKEAPDSPQSPAAPERVDAECQCLVPSGTDPLEARLSAIESQLAATHEVMLTLTKLMHAHQLPSGEPPNNPTNVAAPAAPSVAQPSASTEVSPTVKQRRQSLETFESMSRTISVKDIPSTNGTVHTASSPLVATAAKLLQRITPVVPGPRSAFLTTTQIFPNKLGYNADQNNRSLLRRLSRWLNKRTRVMPCGSPDEDSPEWFDDFPPHPLTFRYDASGRVVWDLFIMAAILVDVVLTPLSLSFGCLSGLLAIFNIVESVAFAIDFVVHALSSYTTKRGFVVTGPSNTIPHYLLSVWAVIDFLACFPFEYLFTTGRYLGIAKVARLAKISDIMRRFHSARKAGILRLLRLIGIVLLVSHLLACYWNWVATVWRVTEDGYLEKSTLNQYIHSWSIIVGSLNASPPVMHTPIEELSVALFMLIGNVVQASVFGSVAALIQSFDEDEVAYNRKLVTTYERCKLLGIPEPLTMRITRYYQLLYRETHSVDPDADSFIKELSPALVCEVKFQLYKEMIRQIPFFSSYKINPVLIETLIMKLRSAIYMQDDMLIRKGEFGDWMGFIGSKGSVGVLDPKSETHKILRILRKGEYFGEMGLLHRTKRTTTAVALSWVQIHVLSRTDLDEVKVQYPDDAECLEEEILKYMKSRMFNMREGNK